MGHRATKKKAGGGLAHLRSGWPAGTLAVSILALAAVVPLAWAQDTQRTGALGFETAVADDPDAQMVLESNELIYDFDRNVVTAQGDVEIYYQGYTLESDRVIYDQNTRRVFARGNVRIVEPDGTVIYADTVELTDDFAEGFVEQLTVITTEDTRFAAISAERVDDNLTIFTQGVYTACEVCEDQPDRAPVWQIKSARIIHDQQEQVVYHENASFELLGMPIAYVPFLRHPDPTVRRRTAVEPAAPAVRDFTELEPREDRDLYSKERFVLEFFSTDPALWRVLNSMASDDMFVVVKNMELRNEAVIRGRSPLELRRTPRDERTDPRRDADRPLTTDERIVAGRERVRVRLELEVYRFERNAEEDS